MRRIALLLALACPAFATSTEEVTVDCPVCGNKFKAEKWRSTNSFGGQDRDFCPHAAGGQVFIISCWTCPGCSYTGFPDDFDAAKAPKERIEGLKKASVLKPAEPIDAKLGDSREIAPWVRYDLLLQVLKLDPGTKAIHLASTCLRTAQTQRFEWRVLGTGGFDDRMGALFKAKKQAMPEEKRNPYEVYLDIARSLESDADDAKSALDAAGRIDARIVAAVLYKQRGEDPEAQRILESLAKTELTSERKAVIDDIRVRIDRERKYRQLAIQYFEKHLAEDKPEAEESISIQYLIGVLYRRVGEPGKAAAALEPLLAKEGLPEGFLAWIKDELAKAKAG